MSEDVVFLSPRTKMEPLVGRWYAWSHLVSPLQLALNMEYRYLPLLQSFLDNPSIHVAASRDPQLFTGPFVNLAPELAAEVRTIRDEIEVDSAALREVAAGLRALEIELPVSGRGGALDGLYETLPAPLRGLLELYYDCHGRPMVRLFEQLLYRSMTSGVAKLQQLSLVAVRDCDRDFFLNTPRPRSSGRLDLSVPFAAEAAEQLGRLRIAPMPLLHLVDALGLDEAQRELFSSLTTPEAPSRTSPAFDGAGLRIRYFGHACVLVQTAEVSLLFDPVLAWEHDCEEASLTFHDLPDHIDYVVLTHNHQDHVSIETLLQLRGRIGRVITPRHNADSPADPSLRLMLEQLGFTTVQALDPLDTVPLPGGQLISLPFLGEHADLNIHAKQGLFLGLLGVRMLFLADSRCLDRHLYRRLSEVIGKVDLLFIGMECHGAPLTWLYGPYLATVPSRRHDESRRLSGSDCDRAWAVVEEVGCERIFVYAMGQEPWLRHILGLAYSPDSIQITESDRFVARARAAGIPAERLLGCREFSFGAGEPLRDTLRARSFDEVGRR